MEDRSQLSWKRTWALAPGIMLFSMAMLNFEIALTKIFSVTLWYHFGYFVVSLSLFGIGAGGIITSVLVERFPGLDPIKWIVRCVFIMGVAIVFSLLVDLNVGYQEIDFTTHARSLRSAAVIAGIYLVSSLPFYIFGIAVSLLFRYFSASASRIYAFDLAGSSTGCLIFLGLITVVGGPTVVIFSVAIAFASFLFFETARRGLPRPLHLGACLLLALLLFLTNGYTNLFEVKYTKGHHEQKNMIFEKWSPLARITVYSGLFFAKDPLNPFGWGMSPTWKAKEPLEQLWIDQDASAGTPITKFNGDFHTVEHLKYDVTAFPYRLRRYDKVFIIGSGGGRDVLTALLFGTPSVVACDINPVIIGVVRDRFKEFAGNVYTRPGVEVRIGDARNVIRHSADKYDLIQMSLIDSYAATMAGALSLSENSLYTVEAFSDYWDHLNDNGVLSLTRYLFMPRTQTLRVLTLTRALLESKGIADPRQHVAVIGTSRKNGMATVIVKKSPLTPEDIQTIKDQAGQLQFEILLLPGGPNDKTFDDLFNAKSIEDFTTAYHRAYNYNMTPTTDDRPFFFQMVYFSGLVDLVRVRTISGQYVNYYAVLVVAVVFVIALFVVAVFMIFPLLFSKQAEGIPFRWGLYCMLIGMGFMFVEIPLMQKGSLYLGHPTYGFSVVLFSLLLFCSLGSYLSKRLDNGDRRTPGMLTWAIAAALVVMTLATEFAFPATLGWPLAGRVALVMALVAMAAVLMGGAFPLGMMGLNRTKPEAIPWAWAINGAASVLGSVMAMAVSMAVGYRLAIIAGIVCYLAAGTVLFIKGRSQA